MIKYEASTDSYTAYKQTGALYLYQYVDSTNNNYWYGVTFTENITESTVSNMNEVSLITVEISTTGFSDANSSHTVLAGVLSLPSFTSYTWDTSVDNLASNLIDNYSSDCDNSTSNETTSNDTNSSNNDTTSDEASSNDTTSNEISSNETEENEIIEDEAVENLAVTTLVSSGATASVTAIASFANTSPSSSSGGGQSTWALINMYQLIILLPLLGTYLENDFLYYITELEMFSFNFKFMKNIPLPIIDSLFIDKLDYEQPDQLFEENNFDSGSAFYNHYGFVKTLLFIFLAN